MNKITEKVQYVQPECVVFDVEMQQMVAASKPTVPGTGLFDPRDFREER